MRIEVGVGLGVVVAVSVWACGPTDSEGPGVVVRDSAGIQIVENWGEPAPEDAWTVSSTPSLTIGAVSGEESELFAGVNSAARLRDGTIALAEMGTKEIRFFTAAGEHIRSVGGTGEGPGEFEDYSLRVVPQVGDTLLVDGGSKRVWWDFEGRFLREERVDRDAIYQQLDRYCGLLGSFADESWLVQCREGDDPDARVEGELGAIRVLNRLFHVPADFSQRQALGPFGDYEFFPDFGGHLFLSHSVFAAGGAPVRVAVLFNPEYSVEIWALDGTLERIIRRLDGRWPLTPEDRSWALEMQGEFVHEDIPFPELIPTGLGLALGPAGDVWIHRWSHWPTSGPGAPTILDAFDREGRFRGQFHLPDGTWLLEVGQEYLLVRRLDENAVPFVELYGLER